MKIWNKTVLTVLLQWDYGQQSRGPSCDKLWFFDSLEKLCQSVVPFWYDQYLSDPATLQEDLLAIAAEVKPDLIFFLPFQEQFSFATLDRLKELTTTVAWFGDDTWRFDSFSSRYAPHFSRVATADLMSISKYRRIGVDAILTEWAAATPISERIGPLDPSESYEYDVSFVGGKNKFRAWFLAQMAKQGIKIECFGAGWPNGRLSFAEMEQVFRKSKINLNISNSINHDIRFVLSSPRNLLNYLRTPKRAEQVKARNFEIPLAGGFQVSNYVLGLERHFEIGKEIAVYNTPEECVQQIRFFLENDDARQEVLGRSHERAIKEHTYINRLNNILQNIWSL